MRERFVCRQCTSLFSGLRSGGRRPFQIAGATPHYAPDRPVRIHHVRFDLRVDPEGKTLHGKVTQSAVLVGDHVKRLTLDQIGLEIEKAWINETVADYAVEGEHLHLNLPLNLKPGDSFDFTVQYRVKNPKRGIYFTGPEEPYPKKPFQVWTQGQDEDSRYWFPSLDHPCQKSTTEMIVTVPQGYTAVSNGALVSKQDGAEGTRFHYKLGTPHVTYLTTLVVARFSEISDKGPSGLPVIYYVEPGREEDARRAFSNTPKMIEAFTRKIGVPYAFEKYSQAAVQDFIFGGMENTSATTQTDLTLHDARAHLDFSSDPLVAHELAHQWFGNLLTCRDWSHGWLNEGFATFMERVWVEEDLGPNGGGEEAKYYSYVDFKEYLDEDSGAYRRPIVCNTYIEPIDLFDRHLYQKGGLVLNLLRHVLGEDAFWRSVRLYVSRHSAQNVETIDLIRAIEDATGRNLRRFFDEWVFGAGHPELEVSYAWDADKKMAELVIEQKQDLATTHLFHLPITVELTLESGKKESHRIEIGEGRDRVFLPASSKPLMVRLDPGFNIPKAMKFPRPKEMLSYQLENDPDCMGRIEAAQELIKNADEKTVEALSKALLKDPFWGTQAEIAQALSKIRTGSSRDALIAGLAVQNPKARRAVVKALGTFRDRKAVDTLRRLAEKDPSYFVEGEATLAWAAAHPVDELPELSFLEGQLKKSSYRDLVQSHALRALGERPQGLSLLREWTRAGRPMDARAAAISALGRVAKSAASPELSRILEEFDVLADDNHFRIRMSLVAALEESGSPRGIPILEKIRNLDWDGRVRRNALTAIDTLRSAGTAPESVAQLKTALEKLEDEYRKLRDVVSKA